MKDKFPPYEAPTDKPHLVPIVFGDWSRDGHNLNVREYVWSNKGIAAWREAFAKGCKLAKVDLAEKVAARYEDRTITRKHLDALRASGFSRDLDLAHEDGGGARVEITLDDFAEMFFHLVRLGDPSLVFDRMKHSEHHMEVHPGGYGLLGN